MSETLVGVILTGFSGVLIAVGAVLNQTRFSRAGSKELSNSVKRLSRQVTVAFAFINRLENMLAGAGLKVPRRPKELDPNWGFEESDELERKREAVKRR